MRWIAAFASVTLAAQGQPEFMRDEPKAGVIGYRDGRMLLGKDVDVPGTAPARLLEEDREGKLLREFNLKPDGSGYARFRVTTASLTADGDIVAGGMVVDSTRRMQNLLLLGNDGSPVPTGSFSCQVVAAATKDTAWCLGYSIERPEQMNEHRHLLYRLGADGKPAPFYPLPTTTDQRTAE